MSLFPPLPNFLAERNSLLEKITHIDRNIFYEADATTLIFGNPKYSNEVNLQILNAGIDFILTPKRFNEKLSLKFLIIKIS